MAEQATGELAGSRRPQEFGFLLQPQFALMSFSSVLEPLRAANRLANRELYRWLVLSADGPSITSSGGINVVPDRAIADVDRLANVFVVAGLDAHRYDNQSCFAWLRRMARSGSRMGALSTGSYSLARAGLLQGYRCTLHWENLSGFKEDFPDLEVTGELFEIDRNRITCAGGTASLDLMLSLIALDHGRDLATRVAEQFMHSRIRDRHDKQRMSLRNRLGISHPKLISVIELMEKNLEEPLTRKELAAQCGLSPRQLERLFKQYVRTTPMRFYLELRLQQARALLVQTSLSALDVALASGFVSAPHFSKCYREHFGHTPRSERWTAATPLPAGPKG